jgi:Flp pilus assembly pilin Flp
VSLGVQPGLSRIIRSVDGAKTEVDLGGANLTDFRRNLWSQEEDQDIAEYAVMLAVILVLVIATIRVVGTSANNVFSATQFDWPTRFELHPLQQTGLDDVIETKARRRKANERKAQND